MCVLYQVAQIALNYRTKLLHDWGVVNGVLTKYYYDSLVIVRKYVTAHHMVRKHIQENTKGVVVGFMDSNNSFLLKIWYYIIQMK